MDPFMVLLHKLSDASLNIILFKSTCLDHVDDLLEHFAFRLFDDSCHFINDGKCRQSSNLTPCVTAVGCRPVAVIRFTIRLRSDPKSAPI